MVDNAIKHNFTESYARRVIEWLNKEEGEEEVQKLKPNTSMITFSGLIHKRENQSDLMLDWIVLQNIYPV